MDVLRSWFEVPAIAHFFHIFKNSFGLIEFDIEDFEEALFLDNAENCSSFLPELVVQLLRGLYKTKDGLQITIENYSHYLQDLLEYRYAGKQNPVKDGDFKTITTREKVDVLYDMCNWRLELEDAMELTKNLESEEMRVMPVGFDKEGYQYWYFYGTRLYQEKCVNDETVELSDSEETSKPQIKIKKKRGKKRKICRKTKSGRAVKPRMEFDCESEAEEEDGEESESETKSAKVNLDEKPVLQPQADNQWSLTCSTVQEWADIVARFENTNNKSEKVLLKGLKELNAVMPDIFVEKENAIQKKLLAMAPRRLSDRIHIKMQVREDEHRKKEQQRLLKNEMKAREAEKRQKEQEMEKQKDREKRYQERERNLELRAQRAKQREEMKQVQTDPELAKQIRENQTHKVGCFKFDLEGEEDDKFIGMEKVLEVVKDHDDSWPFLEPVNAEEAPNYYEFIKEPMDLRKIGEKVESKSYKDKTEFENDIYLMLDNCEAYNGTFSPFTKLAFKIKKVFEKQMKKEFPPEIDSNDEIYEEEEVIEKKKIKSVFKPDKTPKEKIAKPMNPKHPEALSVFKRNNAILTPEFAHAQILQAQAQLLHKSQADPTISQLLPKLGIPQNVLAKLTPAQMQVLMMQLRSGTFRAPQVITTSAKTSPASCLVAFQSPTGASTVNKPKALKTISPKPVLTRTPGSLRMIAPKREHLSISQFIQANSSSPGVKIESPNTLGVCQVPQNGSLRLMATQNAPRQTSGAVSSNVKPPILHSIPASKALPNPLFPTSANINQSTSTTKARNTQHILNIVSRPSSTPAPATVTLLKQLSNSSHLVTQAKTNPTTTTSSTPKQPTISAVALRALGVPVLNQANVRYIGQPNGQLQKIVYLPSGAVNKSQGFMTQPVLKTQSIPVQRFITPGTTTSISALQRQTKEPNTAVPVPVFLNAQGVPLKVQASQSKYTVAHALKDDLLQNAKGSVFIPHPATVSSKPDIQGLKKAAQQVAAVTNINAKLQIHLENKNNQSLQAQMTKIKTEPGTTPSLHEQSKSVLYKLPVNMIKAGKPILNSPIALKSPHPFTGSTLPKTVATTLVLSPIRTVKSVNQMQLVKAAIPASNVLKQPGISFILTSNGLVSVSLPQPVSATKNMSHQIVKQNVANQNIITSNAPIRLLQKGFSLPMNSTTLSLNNTAPKKSFLVPITHAMTFSNNPTQKTAVTMATTQSTTSLGTTQPAVVQLNNKPKVLTQQTTKASAQLVMQSNNIPQIISQSAIQLKKDQVLAQQILQLNSISRIPTQQVQQSNSTQQIPTERVQQSNSTRQIPTQQVMQPNNDPKKPTQQVLMLNNTPKISTETTIHSNNKPQSLAQEFISKSTTPVQAKLLQPLDSNHPRTTQTNSQHSTTTSETITPTLFKASTARKLVSPEKLRDAEALLGLINPTLHVTIKPETPTTTKTDEIFPRTTQSTIATASLQKLFLNTTPPFTMSISPSPTSDKNQLKIQLPNFKKPVSTEPQQQSKMIISQPQQTSIQQGLSFQKPITQSPSKINISEQQLQTLHKTLKNTLPIQPQAKINIIEQQLKTLQKTLGDNLSTNKNYTQQPQQTLQQQKQTVSNTTLNQFQPPQQRLAPFIQNLQQQQNNTVKSPTTTPAASKPQQQNHKMVVDADQLIKLQQEGKVVVTPNGQMFLVANK